MTHVLKGVALPISGNADMKLCEVREKARNEGRGREVKNRSSVTLMNNFEEKPHLTSDEGGNETKGGGTDAVTPRFKSDVCALVKTTWP